MDNPEYVRPSVDEAIAIALEAGKVPVSDSPAAAPVEAPEPAPEPLAAEAAPEVAPVTVAPTVPDAAPAEPAAPDARFAALMAREAKLLEAQQALEQSKSTLRESIRAELEAAARRELELNPRAYIKRLAPDRPTRDILDDVWYDENPDAAPVEWKAKKAQRTAAVYQTEHERTKADLDAVTKRQSEAQAQQEAQAREQAYVESLRAFVPAVPATSPRAKYLSTQNADMAVRMMYDAASKIAAAENRLASNEETIQVVEKYLESIGYAVPVATPAATPVQPPVSAPATSLRNANSSAQPGREVPDVHDPKVLQRRALEAAGLSPDTFDR